MILTIIWFLMVVVCVGCIPAIFLSIRKINKRLDEFDFELTSNASEKCCVLPDDIPCTSRELGIDFNKCKAKEDCEYKKEILHE